jgi:hypothetical protein
VANESVRASTVFKASPAAVFAVLVDPAKHAAIDGTGWVCLSLDGQLLAERGQVFRMAMYHPNHPKGNYEMANLVEVFDPPSAIAWKPGYDVGDGTLGFGGWVWRYDLAPLGPSRTEVTLSYDWSSVDEEARGRQARWPPFPHDHLDNSLLHLGELVDGI